MSYCDPTKTSGFIQLTGGISQTILQNIPSITPHELTTSFAQQTTLSLDSSNHINDTGHNSCMYRSKQYTQIDVQLCKPIHIGYNLPGSSPKESSAEMIVAFSAANSEFSGILFCFPIYDIGSVSNNQYIMKAKNGSAENDNITLQTIINQPSLVYKTCFESIGNTVNTHTLYIVVFPNGIQLSKAEYTNVMAGRTLTKYSIPPNIRNGQQTALNTAIVNGKIQYSSLSPEGHIYTKLIATCDEDFKHKFQYFANGPMPGSKPGSTSGSTSGSIPNYPTSQYKCVPLDKARISTNNNGNQIYITPGNTAPSLQDTITDNNSFSNMSDTKKIETVLITGGSVIAAIIVLGATGYFVYNAVKE